jgi:hypothetical protein
MAPRPSIEGLTASHPTHVDRLWQRSLRDVLDRDEQPRARAKGVRGLEEVAALDGAGEPSVPVPWLVIRPPSGRTAQPNLQC